jgi:thiol:disulfide interchange protein/DsbC/DsbD-like thiol-disulfide interchange protein
MPFSTFCKGAWRALVLLVAILAAPSLAPAAPVQQTHISLELISQGEAVAGAPVHVALREKMDPSWHTYWISSGVGNPTRITWTLPRGWTAGPISWPVPRQLPTGPLMDYGYEDEVVLPVAITAPKSARVGDTGELKAHVQYQVCSDVCIPGEADLAITLTVAGDAPKVDPVGSAAIAEALAKVPPPADFAVAVTPDGATLKLSAAGGGLKGADVRKAYFFPYTDAHIDYPAPQAIERGPEGLTLTLTPDQGRKSGPVSGVLSLGDRAFEISAKEGPPVAGAAGQGTLPAYVEGATTGDTAKAESAGPLNLILKLLAALAGGLILNLMPCVFPVLSMKAAQLASHTRDMAAARRQGLAFLAGCLVTFLALAGVLLAARAAGTAVGWGFQLQSPPVVAALSLLMLLVALDLSGVFEIGLSVQGAGSGLASRSGLIGSFFTGALAVVVAAPCTAPLMGPALAFALGQPPLTALAVFAALGLGFAAPFTLLAFAPPLLKLIPRPGAWMNVFKTVLAFPMYGAAVWLAWVFSGQAGHLAMGVLLIAALVTAFGAWLFGQGQKQFSPVWRWVLQLMLPLALIASALLLAPVAKTEAAAPPVGQATQTGSIAKEAWSADRVAALQAEGRPVFVDFTADWCITCKVNETTSLSSAGVAQAFASTNAAYLVGDWTNRNADIAKVLAEHNTAGVPLYLVYPAGGGDPEKLPQFLTEGIVKTALQKAAKKT